MNKTSRTFARFMRAPLVKWPAMAARLPEPQRLELSRAASDTIQRLSLLGEYAETLGGNDHAYALTKAQRLCAKVRKALGYSYPKQGLPSVNW